MVLPEDEEEREEYFTGLKKTFLSTAMGVAAGVFSFYITWESGSQTIMREPFALILLLSAVWFQRSILPYFDVDPTEFDAKDWLFLGFMTITFAMVTWTLLIPVNPLR